MFKTLEIYQISEVLLHIEVISHDVLRTGTFLPKLDLYILAEMC